MRSAIISIASSRSSSCHSVPCGGRYLTLWLRSSLLTSCSEAAPFGQSLPRETGLSGSPSIWVTLPSLA